MRHSQFTDREIAHLLLEAQSGVPIAEICRTSHVSLRTFYRWKRRFGGLQPHAVLQMKELEIENRRLRALVGSLTEQLRDTAKHHGEDAHAEVGEQRKYSTMDALHHPSHARAREGVGIGRFAGVRISG